MPLTDRSALAGGSAVDNAAMIDRLLDGETGPRRDVVLLNAAAALLVADRVSHLRMGVASAIESLDSGRARAALDRLREVCPR